MCNRHELPPILERDEHETAFMSAQPNFDHDPQAIIGNRIKRRELPIDPTDPIDLRAETEAIFKGLLNAFLLILILSAIAWGLYNMFCLYQHSQYFLAMGDWSKQ